jgi:hypothetical protein
LLNAMWRRCKDSSGTPTVGVLTGTRWRHERLTLGAWASQLCGSRASALDYLPRRWRSFLSACRTAPTKASSQDSVGYDVYDLWDLGEWEQKGPGTTRTKYGTKAELSAAVAALHDHGVVSYVDAVLNHKFGAEATEQFQATPVERWDRTRTAGDMREIEVIRRSTE